ncbi:MAG: glycosyltransferase, partial [Chitinophagaceae bacterium]
MNTLKGFSIIICCYNSARILPVTLGYLANLISPEGWAVEVILIDNCCTDNTSSVAREVWEENNSPFKLYIIKEKPPGLSAARVRGIEAARYDYLVFCDDDNFLNKDYLLVASNILFENESIGALGGYAKPVQQNIPSYWPGDFNIYGCGPQAEQSGKTMILHGAGIIIKKDAFTKLKMVGFNFMLSDRKGDKLSSGGDYELCYAVALTGYDVWYEASLKFSHFIEESRFSWEYCKRFIRESAPALDVLEVYRYCFIDGERRLILFYFYCLKMLSFHIYKVFHSCKIRYQYRHDQQIRFLENFHLRFHIERIKSIIRNT